MRASRPGARAPGRTGTGRRRDRSGAETDIHVGGFHAVTTALEAASRPDDADALTVVEAVEHVMVARRGGAGGRRDGASRGGRARRVDEVIELAAASGVPVREVAPEDCDRLSGVRSQGVAATIRYRYAELGAVLSRTEGVLVFLDGIEDPHNLGAVIRSAAAVGAAAVVVPRHRAAGVTASVMRASAGTPRRALRATPQALWKSLAWKAHTRTRRTAC